MSIDRTETVRRILVKLVNAGYSQDEAERYAKLVERYGEDNVYTTDTVTKAFDIEGFMAPFVMCTRKSDNVRGSLEFTHSPRFYFNFRPK